MIRQILGSLGGLKSCLNHIKITLRFREQANCYGRSTFAVLSMFFMSCKYVVLLERAMRFELTTFTLAR